MVRWQGLVAALLCLATACTQEPPQPAEPRLARVGDCYADATAAPVSCNERHIAQTVYVSDEWPADETTALLPCREAQAQFLGQDFNTRLDLQLWVAEDSSWYRCDVLLRNSTRGATGYQDLTGSLKGVLERGVSIDLQSCLGTAYDPAVDQPYLSCRRRHVAQELFVAPAIGTLDEQLPDDVSDRAANACNATAAAARLLTDNQLTAYYPQSSDSWATGERTADCWVTATRGSLPAASRSPR